MTRDGKIIGYGLLACAAALTGFLCWVLVGVRADSAALTASVSATAASYGAVAEQIARPCNSVDARGRALPNGTLCDVRELAQLLKLDTARVTTDYDHERSQFDAMNGQERDLAAKSSALLSTSTDAVGQLRTDLVTLNGVIAAARPAVDSLSGTAQAGTTAFSDLDTILKSPVMTATAGNVQTITGNFAGMSTDARVKFHDLLYPPPCKGWKCRIGRDVNDVRLGSQFIEPGFYLRELFTGNEISGTVNAVVTQKPQKPKPQK